MVFENESFEVGVLEDLILKGKVPTNRAKIPKKGNRESKNKFFGTPTRKSNLPKMMGLMCIIIVNFWSNKVSPKN